MPRHYISIENARQHNLAGIDVQIPRDKLVVITGLSGSGKSSLAFDTIYAEGQRKYVESLSPYARQFLEQMPKPEAERIDGLPPTIAIEQRSGSSSPRSTVATTTEIYDFLRLLYAKAGTPHCWKCGKPIASQTVSQIVDAVLTLPEGERMMVLAPLVRGQKGGHREVLRRISREGYLRARVDGRLFDVRSIPDLAPKRKHTIEVVVDRLIVKPQISVRLTDSIETALTLCEGLVLIAHSSNGDVSDSDSWQERYFSQRYACFKCSTSFEELEPRLFSFNSPNGACPDCDGLGTALKFDPELVVPDESRSLSQGAIAPWSRGRKRFGEQYAQLMQDFCKNFSVSADIPFKKLKASIKQILLHGTTDVDEEDHETHFEGILPNLERRWNTTDNENVKSRLHGFLSEHPCESCDGARLRPEALAVRIGDRSICDVVALSIAQALELFEDFEIPGERGIVASPVVDEIRHRLEFLTSVGMGYISLDRKSSTLSGGEAQRIRLATQVGSGLVGVCYVLDEPTIGLHQRDNQQLISTLRRLADMGNSVIVVEHDEDTIRAGEYVIDMGPGAGAGGGRIVAEGSLDEVLADENSLTAQYLSERRSIPLPRQRRKVDLRNSVQVRGASENNLKHIDVRIPLRCFCCVTGVSGSGKSTLVTQILLPALKRRLYYSRDRAGAHERIVGAGRIDKVIEIDQSPIGRTPRSNPATYIGVFDLIRQLYAKTRESKIRGYDAGRFSFNVKGGRCEACQGQGTKKIAMHFLPDIFVDCEVCKGTRYGRETLEIRYRGRNIADVLSMSVQEALRFFANFPKIKQLLKALEDVGLGYMSLGQASTTLSGGEAQRVKLAAELGKTSTGDTLYILDEPTSGLHFADIENLLRVLNRLANLGNTILVIEHNMDVIKCADYVIDLGPEGGDAGGEVIAVGAPEEIAECAHSHTGRYLQRRLHGEPVAG
jgi:excinuclease ABC subunit A